MGDIITPKPYVTQLRIIEQSQGCIMHGMKDSDPGYIGFGEAYFSTVNHGSIKGWKLHRKMTLNLIVPKGKIRFVIHDANFDSSGCDVRPLIDTVLGPHNYFRLTVPPGLWVAFKGVTLGINLLLNIADIEHDPTEAINRSVDFFNVKGFNQNE
jgi:dTDP-4-dehydrorhamnose 3,5-epimerase